MSSKRVDKMKDFCEFTSTQYKDVLRHVTTRWLSLLPAVQRILECWPSLQSYFLSLSEDNCATLIWAFFCPTANENDDHCTLGECILAFMHNVMQEFDTALKKLEKNEATIIDIYTIMNHVRQQMIDRKKKVLWIQS